MFVTETVGSYLRAALALLRSEAPAELADARLEEQFAELQRASELLEAERLRLLAEIDRRQTFERDGYLSTAAWLAHLWKLSWGAAREQVRTARALEQMPATRRALEANEVSPSALRVLVHAREADPEAFGRCEEELVEAARRLSAQELQRVVAYWRQCVEQEQRPGEDRRRAARRLYASLTLEGMVRVDGDLDPETGETLLSALRAVVDAEARSSSEADTRTPAQRRADALGEICRQWLDFGERASVAGEKPHVTVTVDSATLRADAGGSSELDQVGPVDPETGRRLACDAAIRRVVMAAPSEPLDVGRRTPVVPPALRRAVVVRDRHCRFPGCERPHTWCDVHHVLHWAQGGRTALPNLLLLCRPHHRRVHEGRFVTLELVGGEPVFRRSDGSLVHDRAPP
jgi:Domain of unknown function (DUF222)